MRIISMTATFGRLEGQTLNLQPGLNVIAAPNEWGKSTWCAFLTAMLYGVDTRERSTQDKLADKEKYMPWTGKPMEGILRLEYQGRDITIQRRTKGRTPLGEFAAWETATGLPIRELTGENCGQTLLGVERSVFRRTGFVRFQDLPVIQDEALRRRLNGLVTTGDESGSADLLGKKLRELKNRCRYNRTGLIPEVREQIRLLENQLQEQRTLQQQREQLEERIRQTEEYLNDLEIHRNSLAYRQAQEDRRVVEEAAEAAKLAQAEAEELELRCAGLPERGELLAKINQGQAILDQLRDQRVRKPASKAPLILMWILTVAVLAVAGALLLARSLPAGAVTGGIGLVLALVSGLLARRRSEQESARLAEQLTLQERRETLEASLADWRKGVADLEELEQARRHAAQARSHFQTLLSMVRQSPVPVEEDRLTMTREETMGEIGRSTELLRRSQLQLGQCAGRMENLPDREILQSRLELAMRRLAELEKTYLALDYAQKALEGAMQELQRRFAPRITRRAGEFLNRMTGGRYDRIAIGEDLTLSAARQEETALRSVPWRSEGTADQMYLALRLAVWEAMTPEAPLVLDDAFLRFDNERLGYAMGLLKELSPRHQILLFTCQEREKQWL